MFDFLQLYFNLNYYHELVSGPIRKILKQFFWLVGIISVVYGSFLAVQTAPKLFELEKSISSDIQTNFPDQLIINWDGANLNLNTPSEVPFNIGWPAAFQDKTLPKFLASYDQNLATPSAETNKPESLLLLSQTQLWIFNQSTETWSESMPLNQVFKSKYFPAANISKQNLAEKIGQISQKFKTFVQVGLGFFPIFTVLGYWLSGLVFSLTEATFIWLVGKIIQWPATWVQIFKLNLLIVPIGLSLEIIAGLLYPDLSWSFFHLTYWIIFVLVSLRQPSLLTQKARQT